MSFPMSYHLTQLLTGHDSFKRLGKYRLAILTCSYVDQSCITQWLMEKIEGEL